MKDALIRKITNPNPLRNPRRGDVLFTYSRKHGCIVRGTVMDDGMGTVILKLNDGTLMPAFREELWKDHDTLKKELELRQNAGKRKAAEGIRDVHDLLLLCIRTDFTKDGSEDTREAVREKSMELLGFDPFVQAQS